MKKEIEDELTVFYTDDHGTIHAHHLIRITDNGQYEGSNITIAKSLGELIQIFGKEEPIPLTVSQVPRATFHSFSINPLSEIQPGNVIKQTTEKKEFLNVTRSNTSENMNISGFDKQEKPKRKDEESSSKKGSVLEERKRRRSNSQSLLPPRKSRRREGIDRSRSPLRHYLSDVSSDKELTDNRKYGPELPPLLREGILPAEVSPATEKKVLPFYHGTKKKMDYQRLKGKIVTELAEFLRSDYKQLKKEQRNELHRIVESWKIPKKCEVCHCEMQMAANFLSHVLSAAHISKCLAGVNTKKRRFTLELDYLPLRKEIEHARRRHLESPPKPSQKGSRPPPSRKRDSRSRSPPYNKSAN
ncbi:hypothetical protein L3Y34_001838 [Caenorhabditis briggsae]|uniref:Uncharacterized protein n=1 Tax=Caenorhabditis briggsae TaxID=6238 RepID=A0AAE9IQX4_CAEBR|nr:hypothetical protein L3Y34_001838 [Caenorhabditis briggsae]